jgi:hypothetical protein
VGLAAGLQLLTAEPTPSTRTVHRPSRPQPRDTDYLNGTLESPIELDTSPAATDTIDYVVTDQNGLAATSTRTVIIQAANDNQASSTPTKIRVFTKGTVP